MNSHDYYLQRAGEIIPKLLYITIASSGKDGQPWNSPVYSAFDENLNFYWTSAQDSQHSINIRENPRIFIVIYDSTVPEGEGEGVYIQAEALELNDYMAIEKARFYTQTRKGSEPDKADNFTDKSHRRVYQATPQRIWVNDGEKIEGGYRDYRVEIPIQKLKEIVKR